MFKSLKLISSNLERYLLNFKHSLKGFYQLKNNNFEVKFIHEGDIVIKLPKINLIEGMTIRRSLLNKQIDFKLRPISETLLRKIIFHLYDINYIDKKKSVVDIGCWIGDNALVWAKLLKERGSVFAIDPSHENIMFGQTVCNQNNITNIKWVNAVCSSKVGIPLSFSGKLDHAVFEETNKTQFSLLSNTLDNIVGYKFHNQISLMHVDVEGFEERVLKGASAIIKKSKPIIVFEQHISRDNVMSLISYLESENYTIFLINEVIPNCELDCRNFIAFNNEKGLPSKYKIEHKHGRKNDIFYATLGDALIAIN
jgi:FkbM family methyltransferase